MPFVGANREVFYPLKYNQDKYPELTDLHTWSEYGDQTTSVDFDYVGAKMTTKQTDVLAEVNTGELNTGITKFLFDYNPLTDATKTTDVYSIWFKHTHNLDE